VKKLFAQLVGEDRVAMVEAARRLAEKEGASPKLRELLRHEQREATRHAILYALSWQRDPRAWPIFVRVLSDRSESALVRGQAAEGLAYNFHRKRKGSAAFESAFAALVSASRDASPEVRYYVAFALGASRDERALPVLRKMTKGRAVAAEAREAIDRLSPSPLGRGSG
jgi:HEAT repeat protein